MVPVDTTAYYSSPERNPEKLVACYERAMQMGKSPVRVLLLCNPHNPRGQLLSVAELQALIDFCHQHRLHLISDEIYGLSTFGSKSVPSPTGRQYTPVTSSFTSVMRLNVPDSSRIHTLHGISKDLGSSGLRLVSRPSRRLIWDYNTQSALTSWGQGFIVTQANPLLRMSLAISNHAKVSTISTLMATELLGNHNRLSALLSTSNAALHGAADIVVNFLATHDVPFCPPIAGVFVWAQLGHGYVHSLEDEVELSKAFRAAGVELVAGRNCRAPQLGWFRITFALPEIDLVRGLERISSVLDAMRDKCCPEGTRKLLVGA